MDEIISTYMYGTGSPNIRFVHCETAVAACLWNEPGLMDLVFGAKISFQNDFSTCCSFHAGAFIV